MEHPISPEKQKALDEAQKLRDKAGEEAKLRSQCFDQASKEHDSGNGAKAKELSEEGKKHGEMMKEYNKQAADAYFAAHNQGRDDYTIDLHGLQVEEAKERVNARLDKIGRKGTLVIIWGAGNHSEGGVRKIKPAIISDILEPAKVAFDDDTPNHGCCTVYFSGKDAAAKPAEPAKPAEAAKPAATAVPAPAAAPAAPKPSDEPETKRACACCCVM